MISEILQSVEKVGTLGTLKLAFAKIAKKERYRVMRTEIASNKDTATLVVPSLVVPPLDCSKIIGDTSRIIEAAERMLRDDNRFFTFPYKTREIEHPWSYDPIEKKYWPARHYTEQALHAEDTPKDVKIIWEINRFKDLPTLGQAFACTRDARFAEEAERRMLSWIAENPIGETINWASALEISIRLLSWTATLLLLSRNGNQLHQNPAIGRSIYEQVRYLAADLSIDKVVPTNHLIGEASGLFIISKLWDFPAHDQYGEVARKILEKQIIRQTFADGATREATSWYHRFVTQFFDLVDRVAVTSGRSMSQEFRRRLGLMKSYTNALIVNNELIRFGDADDGWALYFEGDRDDWTSNTFGTSDVITQPSTGYFPIVQQVAAHIGKGYLWLRAGSFGMGGKGYCSHAHDDFLSPILFLDAEPVLVDPGTYVYNGDAQGRSRYRGAEAHNGIIIGKRTPAKQRMNFGWLEDRRDATLNGVTVTQDEIIVVAKYAEWPELERDLIVRSSDALIRDRLSFPLQETAEWHLHLDPQWKSAEESDDCWTFQSQSGKQLEVHISGRFDSSRVAEYDYSPSYRVAVPASMLILASSHPAGAFSITLRLRDS